MGCLIALEYQPRFDLAENSLAFPRDNDITAPTQFPNLSLNVHRILLQSTIMSLTYHILASLLSFQLMLGGQARLPFTLTPSLQQKAMAKKQAVKDALPFIPLDATTLTQGFGWLMCMAGVLVALPMTRQLGVAVSASISIVGWYSQARAGLPYWLPIVNTVLAGTVWYVSA